MKEYIKSYHLILSTKALRIVMYLYPVISIFFAGIMALLFTSVDDAELIPMALVFGGNLFVSVEVILVCCVWLGITSKESAAMEYVKTSVKWIPVLKKILLMDMIRRNAGIILCLSLAALLLREAVNPGYAVTTIILTILFTEAGTGVAKRAKSLTFSATLLIMLVTEGIFALVAGFLMAFSDTNVPWIFAAAGVLVIILLTWMNIRMIMKRVKDGYYDCRNKKDS